MAKVLLVEDDEVLANNLLKWLTVERHSVDHASTCADGRSFFSTYEYDIIILDWELPDGSGPDLCEELRKQGIKTPVLMLTARSTISDRVVGLDNGADDYVPKPCLPEELAARIRALLRRQESSAGAVRAGNIELDHKARSVKASGVEVHLSPSELETFEVLMKHSGTILPADALVALSQLRGGNLSCSSIKVHVSRIKSKFGDRGLQSPISAVNGGYIFSIVPGD